MRRVEHEAPPRHCECDGFGGNGCQNIIPKGEPAYETRCFRCEDTRCIPYKAHCGCGCQGCRVQPPPWPHEADAESDSGTVVDAASTAEAAAQADAEKMCRVEREAPPRQRECDGFGGNGCQNIIPEGEHAYETRCFDCYDTRCIEYKARCWCDCQGCRVPPPPPDVELGPVSVDVPASAASVDSHAGPCCGPLPGVGPHRGVASEGGLEGTGTAGGRGSAPAI